MIHEKNTLIMVSCLTSYSVVLLAIYEEIVVSVPPLSNPLSAELLSTGKIAYIRK